MRDTAKVGIREQRILDFVQQRTGLYFRSVQHAHAAAAIDRAMQRAGTHDSNDYVARLQRDLSILDELVVELVVGETYFFRFPDQFRFLSETILPELTGKDRPRPTMRFWSAGCATGEEAYSLAIILKETGVLERSRILATDIAKPALEKGRLAAYQDWALRGDGRSRVEPYATRRDGFYYLVPEIRDAVHFAHLNLALDTYPSVMTATQEQDVIFCRNVLIYLDPVAIPRVAARLFDSLAPGGWLITAASDPALDPHAPFQAVQAAGGVYYRRPLASKPTESEAECSFGLLHGGQGQPGDSPPRNQVNGPSVIDDARQALRVGSYDRAAELTAASTHLEEAACLHVKALANTNTDLAQAACQEILAQHPLSSELHYLHAVLLMEQRRDADALTTIKRVLFLNRSLPVAHLTMGTLLHRAGDLNGAHRAFRNARDLCHVQEPTRHVPLSDDETYGSVGRTAISQLAALAVEAPE